MRTFAVRMPITDTAADDPKVVAFAEEITLREWWNEEIVTANCRPVGVPVVTRLDNPSYGQVCKFDGAEFVDHVKFYVVATGQVEDE